MSALASAARSPARGPGEHREAGPESVVDRRYRVRREIARGGMGVVLEAEHVVLKTPVALKVLTSTALAQPVIHERMHREARALALSRHPGVVPIFDAGSCEVHGPYLVLERIEGRTLESFIVSRHRLDVPNVIALAVQLGDALAHVHRMGVVHRDVKPANVLITREPGRPGDTIKLVDFGIARVQAEAEEADATPRLTRHGEILGTVEYMSPEQFLEDTPADGRTDVFSLGSLIYECLTGEVPFGGSAMHVMTRMLHKIPAHLLRTQRADVPPALEAAVAKALSIDPNDRYATADELGRACAEVLRGVVPPLSLLEAAKESGPSRRQHARAPYPAPVRIVRASGRFDGRCEDVSEGGILVVSDSACDQGELVQVRLPLPSSGRVVTIDVLTRWARSQRGHRALGLEFVGLDPGARDDIRAYVSLMTAGAPPAARP